MKMEIVYKGTCVLLGICFITMIGYNVGVSKGEETNTTKDEIPDLWELTKPKVEWIELELLKWSNDETRLWATINMSNALDYRIPIEKLEHISIWFLNTTEGYQYRPLCVNVFTKDRHETLAYALLPNCTIEVKLVFQLDLCGTTQETIYYEAYIESEHTIVKGVCEIPNITP